MRIQFQGVEALERALRHKSETDFLEVGRKNIRDIYARSQQAGGTPVDTSELRMSARYTGDEMGYVKEYAPHVEYGHRTVSGGFVPGQYYLKRNVDTQRPIYKEDLRSKLRE